MRVQEVPFGDQPPIDGYGPGGFRIAGEWLEGSRILLPSGTVRLDGGVGRDSLSPLFAAAEEIDVVLVGQGPEIAPLPSGLRRAIEEAGIGVEVMSTPSACRTYNVLLAEDRRVAAVLVAL